MNDMPSINGIVMYSIRIESGSNAYMLSESESLDKADVINALPSIIQKCLSMSVLDENECCIKLTGQSIRIKNQDVYYTIPYHETFTQEDYILYWFVLYVCENSSHVYGTPEKMFVGWVYDMFDTITEQVELNIDTHIYPGSVWVLEESDHVFREVYVFNSIEPVG